MDIAAITTFQVTDVVLVACAAFASAFISGVAGFGGSFILAIALTPIIGPRAVVPTIAVYAVFSNLWRLYIFRKDIHWRFAFEFMLASLPGLAVGSAILKSVPEEALLVIFGTVLILAVPVRRLLEKANFEPGLKTTVLIGFVFGAMSGTAVGSGMLVIAALNTFGLHGAVLLGTDAAIGIASALTRVITFWWLDLLDMRLATMGLAIGLVALPGTKAASGLVRRLGRKVHAQIIEVIVVLAGIAFFASAAFGA